MKRARSSLMKARLTTALLCALSIVMWSNSAHARLGETLDECTARYGPLLYIKPDDDRPHFLQHVFRKGNIEVRVRFLNGRSGEEVFFAANGILLTNGQVREILAANAQGLQWREVRVADIDRTTYSAQWSLQRTDGLAYANYVCMAHISDAILTISTPALDQAIRQPGSGF